MIECLRTHSLGHMHTYTHTVPIKNTHGWEGPQEATLVWKRSALMTSFESKKRWAVMENERDYKTRKETTRQAWRMFSSRCCSVKWWNREMQDHRMFSSRCCSMKQRKRERECKTGECFPPDVAVWNNERERQSVRLENVFLQMLQYETTKERERV